MFRDMVSKFAQDVIKPEARKMDEAEMMDPKVIQQLFDAGLMGIETPEELGGAGASFTSAILVVEELAKVDPSVAVMNDVQNTLVNTAIRSWGSDFIKEKYLPQLATEKIGAFGLSEAGSGSDAFALATKATPKGDGYVLNGSKMWITNSYEADTFVIFANADPSKGYKGITAFVVERDMGVTVAKKEHKLGIRASSTCSLSLEDVYVPKENLLGNYGEGYKIAIKVLNEGRIGIGAQMVGLAQGAFNQAMKYTLQERKQFGQYVGSFQGMQFQAAQIATEIEAARLLLYNAARMKEEGKNFVKEAAMAKLYCSQIAQKTSSWAVDAMGGVGYTREFDLEKFHRDSKIGTIYEGTSNIHLLTIAKLLAQELH